VSLIEEHQAPPTAATVREFVACLPARGLAELAPAVTPSFFVKNRQKRLKIARMAFPTKVK
jgi:hypothetical protein